MPLYQSSTCLDCSTIAIIIMVDKLISIFNALGRMVAGVTQWSMRRKAIASVIAAIIIACIIFSIPILTVPCSTIEIYTDTEMRKEPYTATEPSISYETRQREKVILQDTPYSVPDGISVSFSVTEADSRLDGSFRLPADGGFYLYSSTGAILYEQLSSAGAIDIPLDKGTYKVTVRERVLWGERMNIDLRLKWTEEEEVTEYGEVTKYHEIPVTVEKQRTVTGTRKSSIWGIIFGQ